MSSYGKHYVCKPEEYLEPKIGASGTAAWPANTVPKLFKATAEKYPNNYAMMLKRRSNPNDPLPEEFNMKWTWKEYYSDCRNFAKTLIKLNIKQFGICNILVRAS